MSTSELQGRSVPQEGRAAAMTEPGKCGSRLSVGLQWTHYLEKLTLHLEFRVQDEKSMLVQ